MTKSLFQRTDLDETADCQRSSGDFNRLHMVCSAAVAAGIAERLGGYSHPAQATLYETTSFIAEIVVRGCSHIVTADVRHVFSDKI